MEWKEQYERMRQRLQPLYGNGEASALARLLCEWVGKEPLGKLNALALTPVAFTQLESGLEELLLHRPLQYITGEAWFYGRTFRVNPSVLIPRPETEELADLIIRWVKAKQELRKPLRILDIGTGSGCLAITLQLEIPGASVTALDISPEALATAAANGRLLQAVVDWCNSNFLDPEQQANLGNFDVIVSNPPYIAAAEADHLQASVVQHEPREALFVPDADPLIFYRAIADFGITHLLPGGRIYTEINQRLGPETAAIFRSAGYAGVDLQKDMSGNDRFVIAE
ncbi:MAG TPA: peptide chain release factor N(5)-glutamine methyltransferase [Lacibacter sp.]|nr:peptide chain release factor N(5)-glutamine methyltransferase [Lacibacter sp.]HMO87732.1 peptide chain release factor N(5)-glutamine methyltransferase [Lacibacter sp.]HMP86232.1 peptide chain release factor N(5)-glutamine methyltransferase [Lacibacter sp.]